MRHAITATLLGAALLAGCGGEGDKATKTTSAAPTAGAAAAKPTTTIEIADFVYAPTPATAKVGQKITIANADAAPHTITDTGSGKAFDSGTVKGKAGGSFTVDKPGTYAYFCEFHPFMKGEITVTK